MPKKKINRVEDIMEKDILSLYQEIFPLLYENPTKLDPATEIHKRLKNFVEYDFYFYCMQEPKPPPPFDNMYSGFDKWTEQGTEQIDTVVSSKPIKHKNSDAAFDELVEQHYQTSINRRKTKYPERNHQYHYYSIISRTDPKLALGFFRHKSKTTDNAFSADEYLVFESLTPHILLLYRTVLNDFLHSHTYRYFDTYFNICAKIAHDFKLSDAENKLLTEILFGYSNEVIAERNFISLSTVKKHLGNIFKKTDTKNRVDFFGKFFTSPDRIDL